MPSPATIPKYFTILMTEMRDAIIFVGFWRYSMPPPPSPDTTIFNYLNEREREGRHDPLKDFGAHQGSPPPPDATIYLTNITDREGGRTLHFVGFWRPSMPPSPDATLLNYLNDRGGGGAITFVGFWCPPPLPQTPQYLSILALSSGWRPGAAAPLAPPRYATACYSL